MQNLRLSQHTNTEETINILQKNQYRIYTHRDGPSKGNVVEVRNRDFAKQIARMLSAFDNKNHTAYAMENINGELLCLGIFQFQEEVTENSEKIFRALTQQA